MKSRKIKQNIPESVINSVIESLIPTKSTNNSNTGTNTGTNTSNNVPSGPSKNDLLAKLSPKSRRKELSKMAKEVGMRSSQKNNTPKISPSTMEDLKNIQDNDPDKLNKILGLLSNSGVDKKALRKNVNSFVNDPVSRELAMSMMGMNNQDLMNTANSFNQNPELRKKITDDILPKLNINPETLANFKSEDIINNNQENKEESEESDESEESEESGEIEYIVEKINNV